MMNDIYTYPSRQPLWDGLISICCQALAGCELQMQNAELTGSMDAW